MKNLLKESDYDADVLPSKGSFENCVRVGNGEAHVGFVQADVLAQCLIKHPEYRGVIEVIGSLAQECVYAAVKEGGKVSSEDDIEKGINVAVGKKKSGMAGSWEYMRTLEDDYAKANTHYKGGVLALNKLHNGDLDVVMWVTDPLNLNHKLLKAVRVKNSGLKLIDIDDYSLNDKLPNGDAVYEHKTVTIEKGFMASTIKTICTDALIIANSNIDEDVLEELATIMAMNKTRITTTK